MCLRCPLRPFCSDNCRDHSFASASLLSRLCQPAVQVIALVLTGWLLLTLPQHVSQQQPRGPAAAEGAAEAPAHIVRARELLAAGDELDATVIGANSGGVLVRRSWGSANIQQIFSKYSARQPSCADLGRAGTVMGKPSRVVPICSRSDALWDHVASLLRRWQHGRRESPTRPKTHVPNHAMGIPPAYNSQDRSRSRARGHSKPCATLTFTVMCRLCFSSTAAGEPRVLRRITKMLAGSSSDHLIHVHLSSVANRAGGGGDPRGHADHDVRVDGVPAADLHVGPHAQRRHVLRAPAEEGRPGARRWCVTCGLHPNPSPKPNPEIKP